MNCIGAVKRALVRLGILPSFTDDEFKDAETENIVAERDALMSKLQEEHNTFNQKIARVSEVVENRTNDVHGILDHIRNMSAAADARMLFENMIADRHRRGHH
jgi:hypothetical protein